MRAIVYHGKEDMRVESVPDPGLQADTDVLVRVERTAICGSDLHLWHLDSPLGANGFVVGHEFLGTIEDAGRAVTGVAKGDRVLVSCTIGCGRCASCRRGVYSGCAMASQGGTVPNVFGFSSVYNGGQAEAVRVPFADVNCFKVPPRSTTSSASSSPTSCPPGSWAPSSRRWGPAIAWWSSAAAR